MQHSVKQIGENRQELSELRNEQNRFLQDDFFKFAENNKEKYHLVENGKDLLVSTWYSNSLINDFKKEHGIN